MLEIKEGYWLITGSAAWCLCQPRVIHSHFVYSSFLVKKCNVVGGFSHNSVSLNSSISFSAFKVYVPLPHNRLHITTLLQSYLGRRDGFWKLLRVLRDRPGEGGRGRFPNRPTCYQIVLKGPEEDCATCRASCRMMTVAIRAGKSPDAALTLTRCISFHFITTATLGGRCCSKAHLTDGGAKAQRGSEMW